MVRKVIVAMSGGVDSSVAALMMKRKGYEVIGVFLKCWSDSKNFSGECTWKDERRSAQEVCDKLGIPLVTVDAEKKYKKYVVDEMFKDYRRGITPNPDVLCNEVVKFPFLLREAEKFGADAVVTGHFVRVKKRLVKGLQLARAPPTGESPNLSLVSPPPLVVGKGKHRYDLYRAKDEMKDQSYFLYRLKEEDLARVIFPIGKYTKAQVRAIAKGNGFLNHEKKSTVGICFIGKTNMKDFLQLKIKPKSGKIVDANGEVVGTHDGVYYYTIGQKVGARFGLKIDKIGDDKKNLSKWYVASKDIKKNILVVAPEGHEILKRGEMKVKDFHLISEDLGGD